MVEIRFEPLSYLLLNGLLDLSYLVWQEKEKEHRSEPYNPDWEAYQIQESKGLLRFMAIREDQKLIGYAAILIDTDIHRKSILTAKFTDIFMVHDKRGYAPRFVNFIEKRLGEIGVRRMYGGERLEEGRRTQVGDFYEIMGFAPQECLWAKDIETMVH